MKKIVLLLSFVILTANVKAQINEYINFETPDSLLKIDTSLVGNIWQIGMPSKIFFNSAFSNPNAIVTDTINFYPPNNYSAFTIKINDPSWFIGFSSTFINFEHKFDTDSLQDGGYIEVSYDGGTTWTNIASALAFVYDEAHNTSAHIANGNAAYTGHSNGWQQGSIGWCYFSSQTVYLRFVFSSAGIQTNKEGWMLDNINVFTDICEGIKELNNNNSFVLFPNPAHDNFTISFSKQLAVNNGQLKIYDVMGRLMSEQIINNQSSIINCKSFSPGIYFVNIDTGEKMFVKKLVVR